MDLPDSAKTDYDHLVEHSVYIAEYKVGHMTIRELLRYEIVRDGMFSGSIFHELGKKQKNGEPVPPEISAIGRDTSTYNYYKVPPDMEIPEFHTPHLDTEDAPNLSMRNDIPRLELPPRLGFAPAGNRRKSKRRKTNRRKKKAKTNRRK
jgi:hypothetical protein